MRKSRDSPRSRRRLLLETPAPGHDARKGERTRTGRRHPAPPGPATAATSRCSSATSAGSPCPARCAAGARGASLPRDHVEVRGGRFRRATFMSATTRRSARPACTRPTPPGAANSAGRSATWGCWRGRASTARGRSPSSRCGDHLVLRELQPGGRRQSPSTARASSAGSVSSRRGRATSTTSRVSA